MIVSGLLQRAPSQREPSSDRLVTAATMMVSANRHISMPV